MAGGADIRISLAMRLLRISDQMKAESPVFIVGEARSGTSLLYRLLQKHTSFAPRRIDLTETDVFVLLHRVFLFRRDRPDALLRYMLSQERSWSDFLASIRIPRLLNVLFVGPNVLLRPPPKWLWYANLHHLTLRSYFFHSRVARGCPRLVEKTPTNTAHLEELYRTFPQARLLYIHRHPVDVFRSYRRRGRDDPAAGWANLEIHDFCDRYERSTLRALEWQRRPHSPLHMVSYERLTSLPQSVFQEICRFIAEPFEPDVFREDRPEAGRWRGDPRLWGPIVSPEKDPWDLVAASEADLIQTRLATVMAGLRYKPYDPP